MQENIILFRQKEANLGKIFIIFAISMLPDLTHGCIISYLNTALPKFLQANPTGIVLDVHQVSWICKSIEDIYHLLQSVNVSFSVSLNQPSSMLGLIVAGPLSDRLGRKRTLIVGSFLQILVSVAIFFSGSYNSLLVALTFSGCFNVLIIPPSYAYLSEISLIREDFEKNYINLICYQ